MSWDKESPSYREVMRRSGGFCEAKIRCHRFKPSEHLTMHHVKRKCDGGSDHPKNILYVCVLCHRYIHSRRTRIAASFRTFYWQMEGEREVDASLDQMRNNLTVAAAVEQIQKGIAVLRGRVSLTKTKWDVNIGGRTFRVIYSSRQKGLEILQELA